uniref:Putative MFS transporter, AGZA family, xanthine/uracil permease n=1 Tax=Candidatus Kentrum eta TaxID=2126337 RepID=A0A450UP18_9GAMM|nr:MAG: putative MFS transporter, AGZA family, xanthine/uracil permease [Candidatus Kentron sp. H]VFJ94828.1 MAG: putative MFS transporter, AGZA family, xanthine/uracil permease [Candidatus Kentron sp. H]VFK01300.1 MAG: putative MFS transporter, AGZA family, xanthine/uracil permease [Candidatus Kentron sp. H]
MMTGLLKRFVRRDIDGFLGLFIDNLVNLLIIEATLTGLFQMDPAIVHGRILPGAVVSILIGNLYYTFLARKLAAETGRDDVTALPYGISTPILFVYLFLIIGPVYWASGDGSLAWKVGMASALLGGVVECLGSFFGGHIRKITPRAAMLGTLAGIAITFIAMKPTLGIWENPVIGFVPMTIILIGFVARVAMPLNIPVGLVAVVVGTAIAWTTGFMEGASVERAMGQVGLHIPLPTVSEIMGGVAAMAPYLAVIIPMGVYNLLETLQNVESASAAGDEYDTRRVMMADGTGTVVGALLGSCFPTTVYIGHPGWKAVGARQGYTLLNGVALFLMGIFGLVAMAGAIIPKEVAFCILLYIGLVMGAQAFTEVPKRYAPAVIVAFLPHIAGYVKATLDQALMAAGASAESLGMEKLLQHGVHYEGLAFLANGAILTGLLLGAMTAFLIDRDFIRAAVCAFMGALLAFFGIIHAAGFGLSAAPLHAGGYLFLAAVILFFHWRSAGKA